LTVCEKTGLSFFFHQTCEIGNSSLISFQKLNKGMHFDSVVPIVGVGSGGACPCSCSPSSSSPASSPFSTHPLVSTEDYVIGILILVSLIGSITVYLANLWKRPQQLLQQQQRRPQRFAQQPPPQQQPQPFQQQQVQQHQVSITKRAPQRKSHFEIWNHGIEHLEEFLEFLFGTNVSYGLLDGMQFEEDAEPFLSMLSPNGVIFNGILQQMNNPNVVFQFPWAHLPVSTRFHFFFFFLLVSSLAFLPLRLLATSHCFVRQTRPRSTSHPLQKTFCPW
jgi:hypothetical protein